LQQLLFMKCPCRKVSAMCNHCKQSNFAEVHEFSLQAMLDAVS